jgi:hypothetical protein
VYETENKRGNVIESQRAYFFVAGINVIGAGA